VYSARKHASAFGGEGDEVHVIMGEANIYNTTPC